MKKINDTDASTIDNDSRLILKLEEFAEELGRSRFHYLLKDENYLIWAGKSFQPSINGSPEKWLASSDLEFPAKGLQWFINTLELKFFRTEIEGGLPKGKYTYEETVNGENLCVSRMFGEPGYGFRNYSRQSHLWEEDDDNDPQQANFSDELLFTKGLFEEFKKIASKIENGDL